MGLFDALSGKVWHWNTTRVEVHKELFPRFKAFPPQAPHIRDYLFAYYTGFFKVFGDLVFSEAPELRARKYIERVKAINKRGLITLITSYLCDSVVRNFSASGSENFRNFGPDLIQHVCTLLSRDQFYAMQRRAVYEQADSYLSVKLLINDIVSVLGLDPNSEWEIAPWLIARDQIEAIAPWCYKGPNWHDDVTKELSRPPRVGGYSDSVIN